MFSKRACSKQRRENNWRRYFWLSHVYTHTYTHTNMCTHAKVRMCACAHTHSHIQNLSKNAQLLSNKIRDLCPFDTFQDTWNLSSLVPMPSKQVWECTGSATILPRSYLAPKDPQVKIICFIPLLWWVGTLDEILVGSAFPLYSRIWFCLPPEWLVVTSVI